MPPLNSGIIESSNHYEKLQENSSSNSSIKIEYEKNRQTKEESATNSVELAPVDAKLETETKQELLDVDDYLKKIGEFGKTQKIILLLVYLMYIPHCYHTISTYFTGQSPAWKCKGLNGECNMTGAFDVGDKYYERRCSMNRSSWEYVESISYSIVTEWDLICEKKEYPFISSSIFWCAWAIGALVFGWASDRYGRKNIYFISWTMMIIAKFCCGISNHFWIFTAFEFVAGFAQGGVALVASVIVSELVGPSYKSMACAGLSLVYTLAACVMAAQGWLLLNWRHFLMITTGPYLILLVSYRAIPESFRWLRIKHRLDEAENVLKNICAKNGEKLVMAKLRPMKSNVKSTSTLDILKFKPLFVSVLIQCMIWFISGQIFIGTSMAADQLGGSIFRDFILVSLVGLPATFLCMAALNRFGRKPTLMISLGTTCLSFLAVTLIHPKSDYVWGRIGSGMFGQLCMTVAFFGMYAWSLEILPTEIRPQCMGVTSLMARLGACSAPWVAQWLEHVHHTLSFAIMGGTAFLGVILCAQLPETRSRPTVETMEDAILSYRDSKVKEEKNEDEIQNGNVHCA